MAAPMNPEGRSPFTVRKIIPKFRSSANFPQQRLRRDPPRFALDDGNEYVDLDNAKLLLSGLHKLEDDYGSFAPITPANTSENISSGASQQTSSELVLHNYSESNTSESAAKGLRSRVSKITKRLAKRLTVRSESGFSAIVSTSHTPRHENFADSPCSFNSDCNSDAKTEVRNNLSSRYVGTEMPPEGFTEIEVWNSLASTLVAPSVDGKCFLSANSSLCEARDSREPGTDVDTSVDMDKPKVLISTAQCDEETKSTSVAVTKVSNPRDGASSPDFSIPTSSCSSASSSSKGSASSNSSQGILHAPKRAIGQYGYDPFGNSDFLIPGSSRPQRRVHFSNMSKLRETSAFDSLVNAQASDVLPSDHSDDSSTSFEYLLSWCGIPDDLEEV